MDKEQAPFLHLRICQTCGFWKVVNAVLDAFVRSAGAMYMCPGGHGELHLVQPDEGLLIKSEEFPLAPQVDEELIKKGYS